MRAGTSRVSLDHRPDRRAFADWTLGQLHEMIFNGELKPGEVLSEVDLTERLGVSRSPVRDALKALEHSGLVDIDDINGRRVLRPFLVEDVAELYDVRTELEALAARYAATYRDETGLRQLAEGLAVMEAALEQPLDVWLPRDFAFHSLISTASHARRVPRLLSGLWIQQEAFLRRLDRIGAYPSTTRERQAAINDHRRILEAVRDGDPEEADAALRDHLGRRREMVIAAVRASGKEGI